MFNVRCSAFGSLLHAWPKIPPDWLNIRRVNAAWSSGIADWLDFHLTVAFNLRMAPSSKRQFIAQPQQQAPPPDVRISFQSRARFVCSKKNRFQNIIAIVPVDDARRNHFVILGLCDNARRMPGFSSTALLPSPHYRRKAFPESPQIRRPWAGPPHIVSICL